MVGGASALPASQVFESVSAMKTSGAPEGSVVSTRGYYEGSPYGGAYYKVMTAAEYAVLRGNSLAPNAPVNGGYGSVSYIDHLDTSGTGLIYVHEGRMTSHYDFESVGGKREPDFISSTVDSFPAFEALRTGGGEATIHYPIAKFSHTDTVIHGVGQRHQGSGQGSMYLMEIGYGTRISSMGAGVPRIWTDRGGATEQEAYARPFAQWYTLNDPVRRPAIVLQPGSSMTDIIVEGNAVTPWETGILNPCCLRARLKRVLTLGKFNEESCLWDGTWGKTDTNVGNPHGGITSLYKQHRDVYGREVFVSGASYEANIDDCSFMGGVVGFRACGNWRNIQRNPDVPVGFKFWGVPGGLLSDIMLSSVRFGCQNSYGTPDAPRAFGLVIDGGENGFKTADAPEDKYYQNVRLINCSARAQAKYSAVLKRCANVVLSGWYGEKGGTFLTQLRTAVTSAAATMIEAPNPLLGMVKESDVSERGNIVIIKTNETYCDIVTEKFTIGATVTSSSGGSFIIRAIGYSPDVDRVLSLYAEAVTGTVNSGDTLTQAAGQSAGAVSVAESTCTKIISDGPSLFLSSGRYYACRNGAIDSASHGVFGKSSISSEKAVIKANAVDFITSGSSFNFYTGWTEGIDGVTNTFTQRLRQNPDALLPYIAPFDLGSVAYPYRNAYLTGLVQINGKNALVQETGVFTPVIYGATTAGSPVMSMQSGEWTKTGRAVTLNCRVKLSGAGGAIGGMVGELRISGLPYPVSSIGAHMVSGVLVLLSAGTTGIAGVLGVRCFSAGTYIEIIDFKTAGASPGNVTAAMITDAFELRFRIQYETNL